MEQDSKLLVCIAFHNNPEKWKYLQRIIDRLNTYNMIVNIIVDSNEDVRLLPILKYIEVHKHSDLKHPYHLAWKHREHFSRLLDHYDWFMYLEDDMDVPWENFKNYVKNFRLLWPKYVPSFVRIELFNSKEWVTDVTSYQTKSIVQIGECRFMNLTQPYHAFWIMPQKELRETMTKNFVRVDLSRETASSYPMWELNKTPLVMLENGQVSPLCYSYHLPNNYATDPNTPFGKIEINQLIK